MLAPLRAHADATLTLHSGTLIDETGEAALLNVVTRAELLRCIANLCLNEVNHAAILQSELLDLLPHLARYGSLIEERHCALVLANLSPNTEVSSFISA